MSPRGILFWRLQHTICSIVPDPEHSVSYFEFVTLRKRRKENAVLLRIETKWMRSYLGLSSWKGECPGNVPNVSPRIPDKENGDGRNARCICSSAACDRDETLFGGNDRRKRHWKDADVYESHIL